MVTFAEVSAHRVRRAPPRLVETAWAEFVAGDAADAAHVKAERRKAQQRAPLKSLTNDDKRAAREEKPPPESTAIIPCEPPAQQACTSLATAMLPHLGLESHARPLALAAAPLGGWGWSFACSRWVDVSIETIEDELGHLPLPPPKSLAALAPPCYCTDDKETRPRKRSWRAHESIDSEAWAAAEPSGCASRSVAPNHISTARKAPYPPAISMAADPKAISMPADPKAAIRRKASGSDGAGGSRPGACAADVSHAFTLKGGQLTYSVMHGVKRVENRHFAMRPGWYGLHTGVSLRSHESQYPLLAGVEGLPAEETLAHGCLVGAVCISHALTLEQCQVSEPWAFGPVVNLISAYASLDTPVEHKGALSLWRIGDEAREELRSQLAHATVVHNDLSHLPPPSEQPRSFHVRQKAKRQGYEGKPEAVMTPSQPVVGLVEIAPPLSVEV